MFSYTRYSCFRNHHRYTLCAHHSAETHRGDWRECLRCRNDFETEMYVYYGTNEYNFVKLDNPPNYAPTLCKQCGAIIRLAEDAYAMMGNAYYCERCPPPSWRQRQPRRKSKPMGQPIITSSPEILSGTPVFAGTRVPVQALIDYLEGGETIDDFLAGFPTVKRAQIVAFLEEAAARMIVQAP